MSTYKLFPDLTKRKLITPAAPGSGLGPAGLGAPGSGAPGSGLGPAGSGAPGPVHGPAPAPVTLKSAFKDLFDKITLMNSPTVTLDEIIGKLKSENFETLKKVGYFLPASTVLVVETSVKLATLLTAGPPGGVLIVTYEGIKYVANHVKLAPLLEFGEKAIEYAKNNFTTDKLKNTFKSIYSAIEKVIKSKVPDDPDKYKRIFDSLPPTAKKDLTDMKYTADTPEFKSLVDSMGGAITEKKRCDENEFLETLKSGTDRYTLKIKLEGLLKRLDLNSEDEFLKFQQKVVETLTNQFSLFSKFQQKVLDELYKIGIPQIKEVEPDFFQILNDDQTEVSEHKVNLREMRNMYKYDMEDLNYANI